MDQTTIETSGSAGRDSQAMPAVTVPALIRCGRAICCDRDQAERREWWLANGQGAYAAGTVAETLTRRYQSRCELDCWRARVATALQPLERRGG